MKITIKVTGYFLLAALLYVSCGNNDSEAATGEVSKIFTYGVALEVKMMDPAGHNSMSSFEVQRQIFNGLFLTSPQMQIEPDLCESYSRIDDLTWEIKLRQGVLFHNGDEMTADDVVFSLNRAFNKSPASIRYEYCERTEKVDDYTVNIITKVPYPPLLTKLANLNGAILPEKYFNEVGEDGFNRQPIGTGPFMFQQWNAGDEVILDKFADYFNGEPKIDRVIIKVIPEATARTIALETGEIDATRELATADVPKIEVNPDVTVQVAPSTYFHFVGFNTRKAPFDDPRLRRAVSYAINRENIVTVAGDGYGAPIRGFLPPDGIGAKEYEELTYNPDKARQILADAGYRELNFVLWVYDMKYVVDTATLIQADLAEVGINVSLDVQELGSFYGRFSEMDYDAFLLAWTSDGDPDSATYMLYHSTDVENGEIGSNRGLYKNVELDALLERGATTFEPVERDNIYREINDILVTEMPLVPTFWRSVNVCFRNNVKGLTVHPMSTYRFDSIEFIN